MTFERCQDWDRLSRPAAIQSRHDNGETQAETQTPLFPVQLEDVRGSGVGVLRVVGIGRVSCPKAEGRGAVGEGSGGHALLRFRVDN